MKFAFKTALMRLDLPTPLYEHSISEIGGEDDMVPTLPRIRMRNLRFYEQMERVDDETGVLGARLMDIINR